MSSAVHDINPDMLVAICAARRLVDETHISTMREFAEKSDPLLAYYRQGKLLAMVGFIPVPSSGAYLWMLHSAETVDHPVVTGLLARRTIAKMLRRYPTIMGHCVEGTRSIVWLQSLGAKFHEPNNGLAMFEIVRQ
jgi:protein tyrosine phosphatase (PTP) superfamily phosphohydrolase (DUF442 family)